MSKKKRKISENSSRSISLMSAITNGEAETIEDSAALSKVPRSQRFSQKITYLKNHWLAALIIAFVSLGVMGAGLKYLEEDAARIKIERSKATSLKPSEEGLLAKVNPFLPTPTPTPTPQLSKEYIYAGSRLLAVEDANADETPSADLAVWRPSTGTWWVLSGQGSQTTSETWGSQGDKPTPGDYDGDGKTDFCVFRASTGTWYVMKSSDGNPVYFYFGTTDDIVAPADYDGDGITDAAIFRPSNGTWYIRNSSTTQLVSSQFGQDGDIPVANDYDGDGKADIAVWRKTDTGSPTPPPTFYVYRSSDSALQVQEYGLINDVPAVADYDGDGKADFSVRRGNNWYVLKSSDSQTISYSWGLSTDIEVPNDYDGDGKADIAVWRAVESSQGAGDVGTWYIYNSADSSTRIDIWGVSGDVPVPAFYRR